MIEPKEIEIDNQKFIISKFPAIAGREIICNYPTSAIPKFGDYKTNEEMMLKIISYSAVIEEVVDNGKIIETRQVRLDNRNKIDSYIKNWEILIKLEKEIMFYNCSFFRDGKLSTLINNLKKQMEPKIIKMLSLLLENLSTQK